MTEQKIRNQKMLELYSQGHSYSRIKQIMNSAFGDEFTNKELGERMGELKKEMGCATQFQMGYQFAQKEFESVIKKEKENSYLKAYLECHEEFDDYYSLKLAKQTLKGALYCFILIVTIYFFFNYILV